MRILSIGNSFSQDAHRYLARLGAAAGISLSTVNLYIGGCPLSHHAENLATGAVAYAYEVNGEPATRRVSLPEVLKGEEFDVVTLQQVSHESVRRDTYLPYLTDLFAAVRRHQPTARIYLHETWAYADGASEKLHSIASSHREMYDKLHDAYGYAATLCPFDGILPVGTAILLATEGGIEHLHRDGFHLSLGRGRYLAALTWLLALTENDRTPEATNAIRAAVCDFDEPIDARTREHLVACAEKACACAFR